MKGNAQLLKAMNGLLADELAAINQYMVHSEIVENWGYGKLGKLIEKRAVTEMKHAEKLIARILFLEGIPIVDKLSPVHIGAEVPKQFANDLTAEMGAVKAYNAAIKLAQEVGDNDVAVGLIDGCVAAQELRRRIVDDGFDLRCFTAQRRPGISHSRDFLPHLFKVSFEVQVPFRNDPSQNRRFCQAGDCDDLVLQIGIDQTEGGLGGITEIGANHL